MKYFFDKGREAIQYKVTDPAGFGQEVAGLRNVSTVTEAVAKFETVYTRASDAQFYSVVGKTDQA